ncbi:MAG: hypothetical protein IJO79_04550 [Firmicutes bacterium]|nr:hypothetical protein [Bacillota bacterium]
MDLQELMTFLEIEKPEEFEYFEHLAALLESTDDISDEAFHQVLKEVQPSVMGELLETYFEEITEGAPDSAGDFYLLLSNIGRTLTGLAKTIHEDDDRRNFCEELSRFREWYSLQDGVLCRNLADGSEENVTPAVALAMSRLEKLGGDEYDYDFSEVLDYEVEEYILPFAAELGSEEGEEEEDLYDEGLIHKDNPVIDGQVLH